MANFELKEIKEDQKAVYNRFVAARPSGSFLQAWEWGQWQERLGRKAFRFFLMDGNKVTASVQAIQSPLPMGRWYIYLPYGPVVAEGGNFQKVLAGLRARFPEAVFFRVEPKTEIPELKLLGRKSANIQPAKTLAADLRQSEEQLFSAMHPKTRYNIRLAGRHGVQVTADLAVVPRHGLYIKEALDLITQTAERQNFQTFPFSYYEQLLDFFAIQNSGSEVKIYIYKAMLNRELLTAAIMVDFGRTRTYLFGGSAPHHREVMAPYLLHFTAMLDAKAGGCELYDFWGIETASGDTPGFVRFKTGFLQHPESSGAPGSGVCEYPGAYDILQNKAWYHGYRALRRINRTWLRLTARRQKQQKTAAL